MLTCFFSIPIEKIFTEIVLLVNRKYKDIKGNDIVKVQSAQRSNGSRRLKCD